MLSIRLTKFQLKSEHLHQVKYLDNYSSIVFPEKKTRRNENYRVICCHILVPFCKLYLVFAVWQLYLIPRYVHKQKQKGKQKIQERAKEQATHQIFISRKNKQEKKVREREARN